MALTALQVEQAGSTSSTTSWPAMTKRRWRGRRGCVDPARGYGERSGHSTAVDRAAWNVQWSGLLRGCAELLEGHTIRGASDAV
jgi:hypothetical protein